MNIFCLVTKFCISTTVLCQVSEVGMRQMISAWNSHAIPRPPQQN